MAPLESAARARASLQQTSNRSNPTAGGPKRAETALKGGADDKEVKPECRHACIALALVAGVVAVFLEGLGARLQVGLVPMKVRNGRKW